MRKRSKYRPKPVYANPVAAVIEKLTPVTEHDNDYAFGIQIKNHAAMAALTQGHATRKDMDILIAVYNVMEALRINGVCTPLREEIAEAGEALMSIAQRAARTNRFVPTGPEIKALNLLLELHDAVMPGVTVQMLDEALRTARRLEPTARKLPTYKQEITT